MKHVQGGGKRKQKQNFKINPKQQISFTQMDLHEDMQTTDTPRK